MYKHYVLSVLNHHKFYAPLDENGGNDDSQEQTNDDATNDKHDDEHDSSSKTFTQEEVDNLIKNRLARERAKWQKLSLKEF